MKTPFSTNLAPTEAEGSTGQDRPTDKPDAAPYKTANCEEWRSFSPFSRFRFFGAPKNGASILPNAV
jgi:hypothetical protein